ncbi:MAG: PilW family protein [Gemmataceae bacterium]
MRRRNAFTIVELLVAMALIMFIMAILSTAFATATQTFRSLKAVGDLANKLRSVTTILQRDLAADHFDGKKRLGSPNFWLNGPPSQGYFRIWQGSPPSTVLGSPCYIEGYDMDGFPSYRSVNHMLAFTIKMRGDQMGDFLTAGMNGGGSTSLLGTGNPPKTLSVLQRFGPIESRYQSPGSFNYQWADVAWFLQPQIDPNTKIQDTTSGGVPLYTLYRSQHLAVPDNSLVPTQPVASLTSFLEMSCWNNSATGNLYFNSPMDLTVPSRRFGMTPANVSGIPVSGIPYTTTTYGLTYPTLVQQGAIGNLVNADIQTTDVISFDVRVLVPGVVSSSGDPFASLFSVTSAYYNGNPSFYNPTKTPITPNNPAVFDTWSSLVDGLTGSPGYSVWNLPGTTSTNPNHSIPLWNQTTQTGPTIQAIQITIRLWDFKTQQTREVTIVQAM